MNKRQFKKLNKKKEQGQYNNKKFIRALHETLINIYQKMRSRVLSDYNKYPNRKRIKTVYRILYKNRIILKE